MLGIVLALTSAVIWGSGDFSGGIAARRTNQYAVLTLSALSGIVILLSCALVWREPLPAGRDALWAMSSGVAGAIGLASLYRALSMGQAASVAPVSAVIGAAIPVGFSLLSEGMPGTLRLAGFLLAFAGIWLVSQSTQGTTQSTASTQSTTQRTGFTQSTTQRTGFTQSTAFKLPQPEQAGDPRSVARRAFLLACLAGVGFGTFFTLIAQVESSKVFLPLTLTRSITFLTALILLRLTRQPFPALNASPIALLAGVLDAGGNVFFVLAQQYTRLDVAAVLSSLYPASTVLLASALLKEKISPGQWLGVLVCLAAIVFITLP